VVSQRYISLGFCSLTLVYIGLEVHAVVYGATDELWCATMSEIRSAANQGRWKNERLENNGPKCQN